MYRQRPSQVFGIDALSESLTGIKGRDEWTAWQFDQAVSYFGAWVEARLNEFDDKGKPIYKLKDLLADKPQMSTYDKMRAFAHLL